MSIRILSGNPTKSANRFLVAFSINKPANCKKFWGNRIGIFDLENKLPHIPASINHFDFVLRNK